jgi:hypothetical protein
MDTYIYREKQNLKVVPDDNGRKEENVKEVKCDGWYF